MIKSYIIKANQDSAVVRAYSPITALIRYIKCGKSYVRDSDFEIIKCNRNIAGISVQPLEYNGTNKYISYYRIERKNNFGVYQLNILDSIDDFLYFPKFNSLDEVKEYISKNFSNYANHNIEAITPDVKVIDNDKAIIEFEHSMITDYRFMISYLTGDKTNFISFRLLKV